MKTLGIIFLFVPILAISWKIQETELLLGYTLGIFAVLANVIWLLDTLTKKYL